MPNGCATISSQVIPEFSELIMGITQVTAAVRNPGNLTKFWEGLFLVDTGAIDCLVPGKRLREIGLVPVGQRNYELADGTEVRLDVTVAQIEFMGETVGATVIFGQDDAEPILGVTALESAGIEVDPRSQRLKRLPAVRLMGARQQLWENRDREQVNDRGTTQKAYRVGPIRAL
jgi:clan AA aspartic protease